MRGRVGRAVLCLARKKVLLGVVVVVVVVCILLLHLCVAILHLAARDDYTGLLLDPNAPVILVADDADDNTEQHHDDRGHNGINDSAVWAIPKGLQQTNSSWARLFLVHALPHGGGGLISEAVFNMHPNEVFFLYRPLHKVSPTTSETHTSPEEWLQLLLNCSLDVVGHLLHLPHLWKSHSFRATHAAHCRPQQMDMASCVAMACQERNLRAAFTTELSMAGITELLTVYQHLLKVVVVVRDPRALLATHLRTHHHPSLQDLDVKADNVCVTMATRISSARALQQRFPGAVLVLHHEHLVVHPLRVLDAVNQFLGLRVSGHRLAATLALLGLDTPEQERLQLVNMWQLDFTLQEVRQMDKSCRYYRGLEYLPVPETITARTNFFVPWGDAKL